MHSGVKKWIITSHLIKWWYHKFLVCKVLVCPIAKTSAFNAELLSCIQYCSVYIVRYKSYQPVKCISTEITWPVDKKNGDLSSWWETSKVFDFANFWLTGGWARKTFENVGPEKWGTRPTGVESTLEFYLRYGQNWKKVKGQQSITAP